MISLLKRGGLGSPLPFISLVVIACVSPACGGPEDSVPSSTGGATEPTGGNSQSGGESASGGDLSTGGSLASGGASTGGVEATGGAEAVPSWRDDYSLGVDAICNTRCEAREGLSCVEEEPRDECVDSCSYNFSVYVKKCPSEIAELLDCEEDNKATLLFECPGESWFELADATCGSVASALAPCLAP